MPRAIAVLGSLLVLVCLASSPVHSASPKALELRKANELSPFTPPDSFLNGFFLADEMEPSYLFGTVKAFAASLKNPTVWLIEQSEKDRLDKTGKDGPPPEYTLYLEEDCPDGVVYYVFVDFSAMTPKQWIEWRKQFHKNKAEGEYGATRDRLEKAAGEGVKAGGELRFIMRDGELTGGKTPEAVLSQDLVFPPGYDLKLGAKLPR